MAKIRLPFADGHNNRSYLNTSDYLLLNAYLEKGAKGYDVVKRPCWKFKKALSTIVTTGRGFVYSQAHSLYYAVIGDALFSVSTDLQTITEIVRKTPTSATWGAAAAGTFTYGFGAAHNFIAGQQVKISGITPAVYSGVKTIADAAPGGDTTKFTVTGVGADPGAATLTNARVSPILTETGKVYFEHTKNGANIVTMLQIPKTSTYNSQLFEIASAGVVTRVTAANWPTNVIGAPVSVDGYLFALNSDGEVYNMNLEAPTTITSANAFVSADTFADKPVTLVKHHNHVVAMKEYSTDFFYDAEIAAPSSPLAKIQQQTMTIGCAAASSVVQIGNDSIWISRNQNGGLAVHILSGGQMQKVSTPFIERILAAMESFVANGDVEASYISFEGHELYILSIEGSVGTNQAIAGIAVAGIAVAGIGTGLNAYKRTLVYDITTQQWCEFSSYDATTGQQSIFFGAHAVSGPHVSNSQDYSNTLIMERSSGDIYEMSPPPLGVSYGATYKDGTRTVTVKIVTNPHDGGSTNKKRVKSLEVLGDRNTASTTLSVRYSDDDYQTWSTARTVDLSTRPRLQNLGMFQNTRAFEFTHAADTPLRLSGIALDVDEMGH